MTVQSNVRMPGEPSTVARPLTAREQAEVVDAMHSAQPSDDVVRPLAPAGPSGRWSDVRPAVSAAAKRCEMAVAGEQPLKDAAGVTIGSAFALRSIRDETGVIRVIGSDTTGVTRVEVSMGLFGEQRRLAERMLEAFDREFARRGAVLRPQ